MKVRRRSKSHAVRYAVRVELYACPFCRQLFSPAEADRCPECDVSLKPLAELPPSAEAQALELEQPPPEEELLGWAYPGRSRGPLLLLSALGMAVFAFAPWMAENIEIGDYTGAELARLHNQQWIWAAGVAWFVMFVLVLTRRTILHMRGARLAVALMALMVLSTVGLRLGLPLQKLPFRRIVRWGWGLYAAGSLSLLALVFAWRFGGSLDDMPTRQRRRGDETLH